MKFGLINKLTLLDYPEKTACTLFTVGCNFNCPFCQNSSLITPDNTVQTQSVSKILGFLKTRQGLLDGVCISGGEPLLNSALDEFIREVKELGFLVKLDTNGSFPQKLAELIDSGQIDYIAMDIKNTPGKYARTIGLPGFDVNIIEDSIRLLLSCNIPYEFRTTVVREFHTVEDLVSVAQWISGAERYYLQGFVDSDGVLFGGLNGYSKEEMQDFVQRVNAVFPGVELRGI